MSIDLVQKIMLCSDLLEQFFAKSDKTMVKLNPSKQIVNVVITKQSSLSHILSIDSIISKNRLCSVFFELIFLECVQYKKPRVLTKRRLNVITIRCVEQG